MSSTVRNPRSKISPACEKMLLAWAVNAVLCAPPAGQLLDLRKGTLTYTVVHRLHEVRATSHQVEGRALAQPDAFQQVACVLCHFLRVAVRIHERGEQHILQHRALRQQMMILKDEADPPIAKGGQPSSSNTASCLTAEV